MKKETVSDTEQLFDDVGRLNFFGEKSPKSTGGLADPMAEYEKEALNGCWIMIRTKINVPHPPPPLSLHWATPWPTGSNFVVIRGKKGVHCTRSIPRNSRPATVKEVERSIVGGQWGNSTGWGLRPIARMKIVFGSELVGVWRHERIIPSAEHLSIYINDGNLKKMPLVMQEQVQQLEILDAMTKELRDAALTEGGTIEQAERLALGAQPEDVLAQGMLPRGFWYDFPEDIKSALSGIVDALSHGLKPRLDEDDCGGDDDETEY